MKRLIIALTIATLCCGCSSEKLRYNENGLPLPIEGHPRVMVTPETLDELCGRFTNPELADLKEELYKQAKAAKSGKVNNGVAKQYIWRSYEASAFLYLVEKDREAGLRAKNLALEHLSTIALGKKPNIDGLSMWDSRSASKAIYGAAMVYDWCYDLFTDEERRQMIADVDRIAATLEFPAFGLWPHQADKMTFRDFIDPHWAEMKHPHLLAFGIASYDENPSLYLNMADHLYHYFVPARNFSYQSLRHPQGSAYGPGRFEAEILSAVLMTRMGYDNPYDPRQEEIPMGFIYMERPDGHRMVEGDEFNIFRDPDFYHGGFHSLVMTATEYKNGYYQSEILRHWDIIRQKKYNEFNNPTMLFLELDDKLEPEDIEDMPLTRYFPSPAGSMIARTGWDLEGGPQSDAVIAKMDIHDYNLGGHQHADAGAFSIYYKGPLAIDSGAYTSSPEGRQYGGTHYLNYLIQTTAHNSLLICNENNLTGDQKPEEKQFWTREEMLETTKRGEVIAHHFGPDMKHPEFSYLKGDFALAYDPSVKKMTRSFVFLNMDDKNTPACLLLRDHFEGETPSTVKWLLHSEQEPEISGNTMIVKKDSGRMDYNGQLTVQNIWPASADLRCEKIGGKGKEFWHEGRNWPLKKAEDIGRHEAGRWRIELSNTRASKEMDLLNVIQVRPADSKEKPLEITRIETDQVLGVRIADRIVLFSKDGSEFSSDFSIRIDGTPDKFYKFLVTDLKPGNWLVDGNQEMTLGVKDNERSLCFEGVPGIYYFDYQSNKIEQD